jgi:hypothetical protein
MAMIPLTLSLLLRPSRWPVIKTVPLTLFPYLLAPSSTLASHENLALSVAMAISPLSCVAGGPRGNLHVPYLGQWRLSSPGSDTSFWVSQAYSHRSVLSISSLRCPVRPLYLHRRRVEIPHSGRLLAVFTSSKFMLHAVRCLCEQAGVKVSE